MHAARNEACEMRHVHHQQSADLVTWTATPFALTPGVVVTCRPLGVLMMAEICQEFGLVGGVVVILLFLALAYSGVRVAMRAPDTFGAPLAAGITGSINLRRPEPIPLADADLRQLSAPALWDTRGELEEALAVCVYMGGGPGLMLVAEALDAWDAMAPS